MTAAPTQQGVMTDEARIRELLLLNKWWVRWKRSFRKTLITPIFC